ncbi:Reverse transcriptase zinc-binding domain [Macleaya cordata]|uniref:Reverse transcriptase zinc-binding domain n=1 Tax=Macleaya cordata TaxID=56857 RepID=A0A200Q786_MACCD|nr:Reverse transcriptase zinc-binding domain [Macleaya cordata]
MFGAAMYNAIPTLDVLRKRGMQIVNRCWCCKRREETISHLFVHCDMASEIWRYFLQPYKLDWVFADNLQIELWRWRENFGSRSGRKIWQPLPFAIVWGIWLERNNRAFNEKENSMDEVIRNIKSLIYLWGTAKEIFEGYVVEDLVLR